MTKPNRSEIVVVLDRSGSMSTIARDMEGGFDNFITKQKETPGECKVTLTQFDTKYEVVYDGKPLADVPKLAIEPRGGTALLDAVGQTINTVGHRLSKLVEAERPSNVLFVIITDGHENSSKEFTNDKIKSMIEHQRAKYQWEFIFLGADASSFDTAMAMGIPQVNAVFFAASPGAEAKGVMRAVSNMSDKYRGRAIGEQVQFNAQQEYTSSVAEIRQEEQDSTPEG